MKSSAWLVWIWLAGTTPVFAATATAVIRGTTPDSTLSGTVSFSDSPEGLKLTARIANAPAIPLRRAASRSTRRSQPR